MNLKIFTENIQEKAQEQIQTLLEQPAFTDCKVRIMPDVHAGAGCVIGFTADLGEKVIPNIVGVDIGCGMLTAPIGKERMNLEKLDQVIREYIPSGKEVYENAVTGFEKIEDLYCLKSLKNTSRFEKSIGTLGGGNHFIEVDEDEQGNQYLIIHSGSRNLGKQVAEYYQDLAVDSIHGKHQIGEEQQKLIKEYKASGREKEIKAAIEELKRTFWTDGMKIPKELCYLTGKYREEYLHDMKICQEYATLNRKTMAERILKGMGMDSERESFETIHNYIDHESNIVRKGAISAQKDELLLIPVNMRDGCILGRGKGNKDWNESAPHGAGRIMGRREAMRRLDIKEYEEVMTGIFTTSVGMDTLDEAPMAYKPMDEIIANIGDTVEIIQVLKPVYNFKAGE